MSYVDNVEDPEKGGNDLEVFSSEIQEFEEKESSEQLSVEATIEIGASEAENTFEEAGINYTGEASGRFWRHRQLRPDISYNRDRAESLANALIESLLCENEDEDMSTNQYQALIYATEFATEKEREIIRQDLEHFAADEEDPFLPSSELVGDIDWRKAREAVDEMVAVREEMFAEMEEKEAEELKGLYLASELRHHFGE